MTACKAQSGDHQVHYASFRSPQILLLHLQMQSHAWLLEICTAGSSHRNMAQAFGRLPANLPCVCIVSEPHPISARFRKSCTEQVLPGSVRNQRQKYQCLMSNIPCHKLAVLPACHAQQAGSPCSADGVNRVNTCNMRNTTLAALSCSMATAKTTATVTNISKDRYYLQCCSTTYFLLLCWDFSEIEERLIFGISLVSSL